MTDEDDALVQVINHGSVHHAGFLSESTIFALSHDEQFSIHSATNPDDPGQEPEPVDFDDLREPLGVEYVVQVCMSGQGPYIVAGNKVYVFSIFFSSILLSLLNFPFSATVISGLIWFHWSLVPAGNWIRIIFGVFPVRMAMRLCAQYIWMNRYVFNYCVQQNKAQSSAASLILSANIIRQSQSVFTCGEDGFVRVWKPDGDDSQAQTGSAKTSRKEKKQKERFRPY